MPPTHGSQIERSISHLNETGYGVPRANSAVFRRIISASRAIAELTTNFENDAGYDNGSDVASDTWATTVDASINFDPDFNFQDIGYFLKDALGSYAVAGAGPYVHTFTPQNMNTSRQMPSRTYLEKLGGLYLRLLPSIVLTQLTISGGKMGRLKVAASYQGNGNYNINPAGYTSPTVVDDRVYGYASEARFTFDDGSAPYAPSCDIESWSLSFNNPSADDGYRVCSPYVIANEPRSGQIRSEFLVGARTIGFEFSARLAASDPNRAWMQNGTELGLEVPITGSDGTSELILTHDRAKLENVTETPDVGGGFIGVTGRANLLSTSGVFGFDAVLTNDKATYAA